MEKFTDWRDKGTGIAPFLPPTIKGPGIGLQIVYTLYIALSCILLSPVILLYSISGNSSLLLVILKVLVGWKADIVIQDVKRKDIQPAKHYPMKGSIYFCNLSSPLDAILLSLIAQNDLIFLIPDGSVLYKMNLQQLINFIMDGSLSPKKFGQEFSQYAQLKNYVTYLFPEGTCSNGKTVLPFNMKQDTLDELIEVSSSSLKIKTIYLKGNNTLVTPLGSSSKFAYLIKACWKSVTMKCKINNDDVKPSLDSIRITINDGDKYKLVSKNLNIESKKKFTQEFKSYRN
ncbi:hypothetical protein Kpol_505p37 [Vanderwaltozyma polyspora DSM 70294]|uniref:Phospholipid/glycerol acyltransferase domain-containing protein n=1 Tax=Vanderwaltozyma polyspora (strain ATCC 22028 / DSM 70294 / BCRC 21397 / CBS 2163 / NBRC 10782 / NRRL Y-8283 / UCD 57-17) TaxID=436907 RepID=A7TNC8_VANPO|nr:uncharacterized protein Kpol_505p37 [Vanderwaltozyma polyspora DSM 70294]EDO16260.1 hypothetical protein Kpol_505p37 [Vanderwaltozyma polyspora DSM 70294]